MFLNNLILRMQVGAVARSVQQGEQATTLRQMAVRNERLQTELDARSASTSSLQHSLFVVRAHWGGLRKVVAQAHATAREQQAKGHASSLGWQLDAAAATGQVCAGWLACVVGLLSRLLPDVQFLLPTSGLHV